MPKWMAASSVVDALELVILSCVLVGFAAHIKPRAHQIPNFVPHYIPFKSFSILVT